MPARVTKRILVVEDDFVLAQVLRDNLAFEGFEVDWVEDGRHAVARARAFVPDLVLLDVMLPGADGFELCELLRDRGRTPVVMLTAKSQKADKLRGLNLGADDYITKPFDLEELMARVRAVLRRGRPSLDRLVLGRLTIDFRTRSAQRGGTEVHLTHREFELLSYLAERPGVVVQRDELLRQLWGFQEAPLTRSVEARSRGCARKSKSTFTLLASFIPFMGTAIC